MERLVHEPVLNLSSPASLAAKVILLLCVCPIETTSSMLETDILQGPLGVTYLYCTFFSPRDAGADASEFSWAILLAAAATSSGSKQTPLSSLLTRTSFPTPAFSRPSHPAPVRCDCTYSKGPA